MRRFWWLFLTFALLTLLSFALADELVMGVSQPNVFADAKQSGVSYSSSDVNIAGVDALSGRISALRPGNCEITAVKDGRTVYTLSLTVLKAPTRLSVPEKSVQMMLGSYADAQPCTVPEGEYPGSLDVRVSGAAVGMVNGRLFARDIGSATVYIRAYNEVYVSYEVKVRTKPTSVTLNAKEIFLEPGDVYTLSATIEPAYSFSLFSWKLSGDGNVTFDEEKLRVKALDYGVSEITVTTENGLNDTVKIISLPLPDSLIEPEPIHADEGASGRMNDVLPEGSYARIQYESLTPGVIRVDKDGTWTAVGYGEGSVKLSAVGTDLSVLQSFVIRPLPKNVSVFCPVSQMYIGQEAQCASKLLPEGCDPSVEWKSSNPGCIGVDEDGTLHAYAYGTAYISATSVNGIKSSVTVVVLKNPDSIALDRSFLEIKPGESASLNCVFPRNTLSSVSYRCVNPEIATVDESGLVTGVSFGNTAVIATTGNGVSASCFITVPPDGEPEATELEVIFMDVDSNDSIILRCGDQYALIDTGNHHYGEKAAAFLKEMGVTHLKYYIGTHAHLDHVGGGCVILDNFEVDMVLVPHTGVIRAIYGSVWTESERAAVSRVVYSVIPHGCTFYLGSVPFKCIGPISIKKVDSTQDEENSNSMVLRADVGKVSLLFTGDATISEFNAIQRVYQVEVDADVFKNPHHSGKFTDAQIRAISPEITVFSTSSLHIPDDEYLNLLTSLGSEIYMTPTRINGVVTLYTDGETVTVTPQYEDNRGNWYNEITGRPK